MTFVLPMHSVSGSARGRTARRIASRATVAIGLAIALYGAAPWFLPPVIAEGPMIQQSGPHSAIVVAFLTRGVDCTIEFAPEGEPGKKQTAKTRREERAVRLKLSELSEGTTYVYRILEGDRELFDGKFRTNKPRGAAFRFIAFGDSGRATRDQYALAKRMTQARPDLLLHTGDVVYPEGKRADYSAKFFEPYHDMLSEISMWPSLGNHDASKETQGDPYREVFDLPANGPRGLTSENNYWFDYGAARFVVIDSNISDEQIAQHIAPWVRGVFSEKGPEWRVAVFHHPPYTAGQHKPHLGVRTALVPIFDETGVDLVLCGHDHLYERSHPLRGDVAVDVPLRRPSSAPATSSAPVERGVLYVVSGAGGASLYKIEGPDEEKARFVKLENSRYSFTQVDVSTEKMSGQQVTADGTVIDEWTIAGHGK